MSSLGIRTVAMVTHLCPKGIKHLHDHCWELRSKADRDSNVTQLAALLNTAFAVRAAASSIAAASDSL